MVFSSFTFLFVFLPLVLTLYFISPKKFRNIILLIFSLLFYAWGEPIYVFIMLFSTVFDYFNGLIIDKNRGKKWDKLVLVLSIVVNISILVFFKYSDFFIININTLLKTTIPLLNIPLPIGISFYTFQTLSYTIDVYRGKANVQKNIINLATYVTLFPQLIAGPIVRYKTIQDQLDNREDKISNLSSGFEKFFIGLFKKVFIANNIGMLWAMVKGMNDPSTIMMWMGITAFAFQIYYDFSGYSDMAIGLGRMFGFKFLENFNYPYIAKSVTDFWRRWHISLGTWFRDYLYIPLGGNKVSDMRWYLNIFIVWFATGFWHGASWNFVIWGLYYGLILVIEKKLLNKYFERIPNIFKYIYVWVLVLIGWVFFESESLPLIKTYLTTMFSFNHFIDQNTIYELKNYLMLFIIAIVGSTPYIKNHFIKIKENGFYKQYLRPLSFVLMFILILAYLVNSAFNPFLYFRF